MNICKECVDRSTLTNSSMVQLSFKTATEEICDICGKKRSCIFVGVGK